MFAGSMIEMISKNKENYIKGWNKMAWTQLGHNKPPNYWKIPRMWVWRYKSKCCENKFERTLLTCNYVMFCIVYMFKNSSQDLLIIWKIEYHIKQLTPFNGLVTFLIGIPEVNKHINQYHQILIKEMYKTIVFHRISQIVDQTYDLDNINDLESSND